MKIKIIKVLTLCIAFALLTNFTYPSRGATTKSLKFQAEIWADNWFALYVNGKKIGEDSTPFQTERSFNRDVIKFTASYPLTIGLIAKDYVENASGLEYIGKPNQQIGDGGIIAQFRDLASGKVVGSTNSQWRVFVINSAPLNVDCEKSANPLRECKTTEIKYPVRWYSTTFKDKSWSFATAYTPEAVGVKGGYGEIVWDSNANLIWSKDLRLDNTILLRGKILSPPEKVFKLSSPDFSNDGLLPIVHTCDGLGISPALSFDGVPDQSKSIAVIMDTIPGKLRPGEIDIGNHFYLTLYNIPPSTRDIPAGATSIGILGQNFQGKNLGYTPPCSQGGGLKVYTITAYALSEILDLAPTKATQANLLSAMEGKIIARSVIQVKYQRT